MQRPKFLQRNASLLSLYEHNYQLFRLVLPVPPEAEGWFVLEAQGMPSVYVHRMSIHPYTSEWVIGHYYPHKKQRVFSPDYTIRVYHDARLCEAMLTEDLPIRQVRPRKILLNRALGEWLDYCHRRHFRLNAQVDTSHLPSVEQLVCVQKSGA